MIENIVGLAHSAWLAYPLGSKAHLQALVRQKKAVAEVTANAAKNNASDALINSKTRSLSKTALATFNALWLNAEDVAWFSGTGLLLKASESSTVGTAGALIASAATVATANTVLSYGNVRYLQGDSRSGVEAEQPSSNRWARIRKHAGKFGVTMAVGAPINALQEKFSTKELLAHNAGYAAVGTIAIGAAYKGINTISSLDFLENPLTISGLAAGVVMARYANKACDEAAALPALHSGDISNDSTPSLVVQN